MLINERFEGSRFPFEGDRPLVLRSLPEGARVTSALVTLEPVAPPGGALFEETLAFTGDQGEWGARKRETSTFAEADFHARRTLSSVVGSGLLNASLQVDLGGLYIQINALGAMSSPDDGVSDFALPVDSGGLLPSVATQKFKLSLPAAAAPRIARVGIRSAPANLSLRLGSQPSFWARPGELARAETGPDFSSVVNAFLAEAKVQDGFYELPLTVHSDSLCRLNVSVAIDYVQHQAALPGGLGEASLSFDYGTLSTRSENLISVRLPVGARVLSRLTTARVRGSFADSRIVCGPTGKLDPAGSVKIAPDRAQAVPLIFAESVSFAAIDLLLTAVSRSAELTLDLVEDSDGKPYTRSVLPAQVKLAIDSQVQGQASWVNVPLPAEVQVQAAARLWLVVQSLNGEAGWSVAGRAQVAAAAQRGAWTAGAAIAADQANGAPLGMLYSATGGLAWRLENASGIEGPLLGCLHLRQLPGGYQVPIDLEVGQGDAARRVSLQRFQPLGRVDFDLGFAELADAINQVAGATAAIPTGEHLGNGELEDWRRVGDTPADLVRFALDAVLKGQGSRLVYAVGASPDGRRIILAMGAGEANFPGIPSSPYLLLVVNQACLGVQGVCPLEIGPPRAVAISPDGRRACVSSEDTLLWVDLENLQVLGSAALDAAPGRTVFSPDGSRLFLRRYFRYQTAPPPAGSVRILDTAALEQALAKGITFNVGDVESGSIDLGEGIEPVALAVSLTGTRLYVLTVDDQDESRSAILRGYDTATLQQAMPAVAVGSNPETDFSGLPRGGLAISRDGSVAVVVNAGSGEVAVVAIPSGIRLGLQTLVKDPQSPTAPVDVAMHPDGNYAVIADFRGDRLLAFDVARLRVSRAYGLPAPRCLADLSTGERIFAAYNEDIVLKEVASRSLVSVDSLVAIPFGTLVPEEWSLTSGRVQRLCALPPFHFVTVLGDFSRAIVDGQKPASSAHRPSAISQVLPVVGGAAYSLSFRGLATTAEAAAEIFWYGGDCGVRQSDSLAFAAYADGAGLKAGLESLLRRGGAIGEDLGPILASHRLAAQSPAGAEQAEIRFSVPANEAAILDRISLKVTVGALANGDLQQLDQGQLAGWTLTPKDAIGVVLTVEAGELRIRNAGAREAALEQAAGFRPEVPFELAFAGRGEASSANAEARVELAFLDPQGNALGTPLTAGIAAGGSDRLARSGNSPAGTAAALLRLVVPPGASLVAQGIALEEIAMVEVPLNFVAQAPGELRISGLQVVYEMSPPASPKPPPGGRSCPPTPPAGSSGGTRKGCCYCPCCGETDDLVDVSGTETPAGQAAVEGKCRHCGTLQQQIGGAVK